MLLHIILRNLKMKKRTSINLDSALMEKLKELATKYDISQTNLIKLFINDGLKKLEAGKKNVRGNKLKMFSSGQGGLCEGIDLLDKNNLRDKLDTSKEKLF